MKLLSASNSSAEECSSAATIMFYPTTTSNNDSLIVTMSSSSNSSRVSDEYCDSCAKGQVSQSSSNSNNYVDTGKYYDYDDSSSLPHSSSFDNHKSNSSLSFPNENVDASLSSSSSSSPAYWIGRERWRRKNVSQQDKMEDVNRIIDSSNKSSDEKLCTRFSSSPLSQSKPLSSSSTKKTYLSGSSSSSWRRGGRLHFMGPHWSLLLLVLLSFPINYSEALGNVVGLTGSSQKCDNEGEVFPLPGSIENPCFTCLCKGGRVECEKQQCPSLQGCFLIVSGQKEGCCEVCKGCKVGNMTYSSGTETIEDCVKTTCTAGVLTRSQIHCYTPCSHPVPPKPGQCCPTCDSCSLNGREYRDGEEAILPEDPCVRCKCQRGSLTCTKHACPVLACPASATYLEKGECCPRCNGSRTRYVPKKVCMLGDKVYPTETTFRLDTCTNCTCVNNTAVCDRLSCPPLECEPVYQIMVQGSCCPKCAEPEPVSPRAQCVWKDDIYKNGDRWDVNSCRSCICDYGKVRCTEQMCPKNLPCPWGYKLKYIPGKCCPECVGEDGVCTVFGDPHYRTFDGRVFNFQGACKYVLTSDCKGKSFAVRVRNDARESRAFSWTRTVTLKVREGRVTLGQKMRIKVNGKRVALPYNHGTLSITQDGYSAMVETGVGVKLLWDGDSFLEVTVPHALKGRLCGLCGNFNGNKSDDFMTRRGGPVNHPNEFGQSWRVGGKKACTRQEDVKGPEPKCRKNWRARVKAKVCEPLRAASYEQGVFSPCHKAVPMDLFFKACTTDMCECPVGRKCHCEVFTAYARACSRSGIELGDWREVTGCSHKKKWRN